MVMLIAIVSNVNIFPKLRDKGLKWCRSL